MKNGKQVFAAVARALAAGLALSFLSLGVFAQEPEKAAPRKDLVLRGDAKCTRCHDEPEILSVGRTRHGVRTAADEGDWLRHGGHHGGD